MDDPLGDRAHVRDDAAQLNRDHGVRIAQPGRLGQMRCQVAHPLQRRRDAKRRQQPPQLACHWLLQRHDLGGALVDLGVDLVQPDVFGDDLLGGVQVGVQQRLRGTAHSAPDQARHLDQQGVDLLH
ncbi:MAG TPA: hypothetical protein PKA64_13195 [Myxococcota bacterium]|nr:hypothetical protein [Myxococcota bacterium]